MLRTCQHLLLAFCVLLAGPGVAGAQAQTQSWWEERSPEERRVITNHFYQATGHPVPYPSEPASTQRVTAHLHEGTPGDALRSAATSHADVTSAAQLTPPKPQWVPKLLRIGGVVGFSAFVGMHAVDTGVYLYARWSTHATPEMSSFEVRDVSYYPASRELYFGAHTHGAWMFNAQGMNPIYWNALPCTFSGFTPPLGARMRTGVASTGR
jgi:hypothetical protein